MGGFMQSSVLINAKKKSSQAKKRNRKFQILGIKKHFFTDKNFIKRPVDRND